VNWNFTTHKENAVQIVGLDIGYSNLKVAFGEEGHEPELVSRPAGAAPSEHIGQRIMSAGADEPLRVLVDGKEYVAGCSHDRLENWARELHKDYTATDSYRALFNAGLLLTGMTEIDRVVTGLPTSQYFDDGLRKHLVKTMKGEHQVTPKKKILVKDVKIVPQPLGGFVDYLNHLKDPSDIEDASVLVIDPGFFSVDWVLLANGEFKRGSSGTSLDATSVILDEASALIGKDYGSGPGRSKMENAVRSGRDTVVVHGARVEIAPYLTKAAATVGHIVSAQLQASLRKEESAVDAIVMVGGGAPLFEAAIKEAFDKTPLSIATDSVFANARGFWHGGAA
jgi:plasmid segregation protein ParM